MIKPKAPKDMTATEFVDFAKDRYDATLKTLQSNQFMTADFFFGLLKEYASIPAPNPFTPDQIAWMREMQKAEYHYAAKDENLKVYCYEKKPSKTSDIWKAENFINMSGCMLRRAS